MEISFTPRFRRQFKKLPLPLQEEALEKIEAFKDAKQHQALRVHKLKGKMAGRLSFSVNYEFRIVFVWESPDESAICVAIGKHSIYE